MGTKALTVFQDENGGEICILLRQFDGYLSFHGKDLFNFLKDKKIITGLGLDLNTTNFNGMGDLSAQVIAYFKGNNHQKSPFCNKEHKSGDFYLYPPYTRGVGEGYVYTIYPNLQSIYLSVNKLGVPKFIFDDDINQLERIL